MATGYGRRENPGSVATKRSTGMDTITTETPHRQARPQGPVVRQGKRMVVLVRA